MKSPYLSCAQEEEKAKGQIILVDKPMGWTSFDVVKKLRNVLGIKKIGHAGTLDPLATGLLLICTGPATKSISYYQDLEKVYTGELVLGKTTPSIDLETPFDHIASWHHLTAEDVVGATAAFIGWIQQVPPIYSAIKVKGKRAYEKARKEQSITLVPRPVFIDAFRITELSLPTVSFEVRCSKGTYVRSLVRDLGARLGVGAYLSKLCRTQIGPYTLRHACSLSQILQAREKEESFLSDSTEQASLI